MPSAAEPSAAELFAAGFSLHQQGNPAAAERFYQQAVELDPDLADAWHLWGVATARGADDLAEQYILQAIRLAPQVNAYYHNLGEVYRRTGRYQQAIDCYQKSLQLAPQSAETWACLGEAFRQRHQLEFAHDHCRQALAIDPAHPVALMNMAHVLRELGDGLGALAMFENVLEQNPRSIEALSGSALILTADYRFDEAAERYRRILSIDPRHASAWTGLAGIQQTQGLLPEAAESYERVLAIAPHYAPAAENHLILLQYDPRSTAASLAEAHRAWGDWQAIAAPAVFPNRPDPLRPLRLGYVSADFRRHPVAHFIAPVLRHHDRSSMRVVLYAHQPADDEVTGQLRNYGWTWRRIYGQDDATVAEQVRKDEIDILVDLSGHTAHNRLGVFALKPAPIQLTYLGYPSPTGLPTIDYRLTDDQLDPLEEPDDGCEPPRRLAGCFCTYEPLTAPEASSLPALDRGYVTFGSLHHLAKLNDRLLDVWAEVLRRVPNGRLLVARHSLVGTARERLLWRFTSRGIDGQRLLWRADYSPERSHLLLYHGIDITLDTFPWSAHATACESLWMGVPVVTLRGARRAGRLAASVLTAAGCETWIAENETAYIEAAVRLAGDIETLAATRAALRQRMAQSALCDGFHFTRRLEATYRQIWHAWCQRPYRDCVV